jgi:hypothetical protein
MKRTLALLVCTGALVYLCAAPKEPLDKLPLGRDTTFVVGPLDKNGDVDYEDALNAEMSKGVTAANNANVLLVRTFPARAGTGEPPAFYHWLGCEPPTGDDALVGFDRFTTDVIQVPEGQRDALNEFRDRAANRAWVAKDCPPLAEWIKGNAKPLAVAHEAVKRERYFNPLVTRRAAGEPSYLVGALPTVQPYRELGALLAARATLRTGEGKYDEAWADIVACFRLARHMSYGGTLVEGLVGVSIGDTAARAAYAHLDRAPLTAEQARARMKELADLPPLAPIAVKIGTCERMMGLNAVQSARRDPARHPWLETLLTGTREPTGAERRAFARVDWVAVMRAFNVWYDRHAEALGAKDRAARQRATEALRKELAERKAVFDKPEDLKRVLEAKDAPRAFAQLLGDALIATVGPAFRSVADSRDRADQTARTLQVALALAAHKADTGKYPARLADLAPKYLKDVPADLFADEKPLVYKARDNGYQFYSVGVNGKDDGGKTYGDDPAGDDLGLALPLPDPKKP